MLLLDPVTEQRWVLGHGAELDDVVVDAVSEGSGRYLRCKGAVADGSLSNEDGSPVMLRCRAGALM